MEVRQNAFAPGPVDAQGSQAMELVVAEWLRETTPEPVADCLVPVST